MHTSSRQRALRVTLDGTGPTATVTSTARPDSVAVEEPLDLRVGRSPGRLGPGVAPYPFTLTMRTPGHDLELAVGFLVAEGVVRSPDDVVSARHCPDAASAADGSPTHNVVEIVLSSHLPLPMREAGRFVSSACGVCGSASIDAVRERADADLATDPTRVDARVLAGLPNRLRASQKVFDRTGGLHAAGLFTAAGDLLCIREDVGRHNAVDKVVGWAFGQGLLPLTGHVLQVSGRASFELVQKAWTAGAPVLAAVSAPSSLAVDVARAAGLTLVGFSRGTSLTVYSGDERLRLPAPASR